MDWGFLAGFLAGSLIVFIYHMNWISKVLTSKKLKWAMVRSEMFHTMIELGELQPIEKDKD